jgi:nucleotide-binding universal stress UspA family protein
MANVLVPFSDPGTGERAVRALLDEPGRGAITVELLAIVEPLTPGKVGIFLSSERARALATAAGWRWIRQLEALLKAARVPFRSSVALGRARDVIREHARRPDVARVVLGARFPHTLPEGTRAALAQAAAVTVH